MPTSSAELAEILSRLSDLTAYVRTLLQTAQREQKAAEQLGEPKPRLTRKT